MGDPEMTMSDPRILSPERLAEIRANHDDGWMTSMVATAELLDHIAAQAERIAELTAHAVRLHTWLTGDREFFDTDTIDAMRSIVELLYRTESTMSKDRRATPGERMALGTNGPELRSEANAGGDLSSYCEGCDEERDDPHAWRECAKRLQSERDAYLDRACHFEGHLLALRADAEALIAAPDMGRAVALAEAVRRLGGGEP